MQSSSAHRCADGQVGDVFLIHKTFVELHSTAAFSETTGDAGDLF